MKLLVDICFGESIDGNFVEIEFGGVSKRACMSLLPEPQIEEYGVVHPNYGTERMKPEEAKKTLALVLSSALPRL